MKQPLFFSPFLSRTFRSIFLKLFFLIFLFSLIPVLLFIVLQGITSLRQLTMTSNDLLERIESSITYTNGQWNISQYNADILTPHPHGSSGFSDPLYLITADGFVIERNRPIAGYLDSSDFKNLRIYQQPTTITTSTREEWRIISKPIVYDSTVEGIIVVASYQPPAGALPQIDQKLQTTSEQIAAGITVSNGTLDISQFDLRQLPYDISFEVVTKFNRVVANNGRIPISIDPSYVLNEINSSSSLRIIQDEITGEHFLITSRILGTRDNDAIGIVTTGKSLRILFTTAIQSLIIFGVMGLITSIGMALLLTRYLHAHRENKLSEIFFPPTNSTLPQSIVFHKRSGDLVIDNLQVIHMPTDTNQYYLCKAMFDHPKKEWQQDELMEKLGFEGFENKWRTIYDTSLIINKKIGFKLIEYHNKVFKIHPVFVKKIRSESV